MKKYIIIAFIMTILLVGCTQTATDTNSFLSSSITSSIIEKISSSEALKVDNESIAETTTSQSTTTTSVTTNTTTSVTTSKPSTKNSSKEPISYNDFLSSNKTTSYKDFTPEYNTSLPSKNENSSSIPSAVLEEKYKLDLMNLNATYALYKNQIVSDCNSLLVSRKTKEDDLKYDIATLQNQYSSEINELNRQIKELERKQIEAEGLGATNSYYATLAKQYQNQINNLNAQKSSIESKYGNQIEPLQKELDELPTKDDILNFKESSLANLDKWYSEQLNNLNKYYGK